MDKPTLVVISGPAGGTGKTTLAHNLAPLLGCPAICRDEIKEGMVYGAADYIPAAGDALTQRTFRTFFAVLNVLIEAGVTVVAEAAFQDHLWRPNLEPLIDTARIRIIHCAVDRSTARARAHHRDTHNPRRAAHVMVAAQTRTTSSDVFVPVSLPVPSIQVDTTDGYRPALAEIVAFIEH